MLLPRGENAAVRLRLSSIVERLRASLFVLPMAAVVIAIGAAALTVSVDSNLDPVTTDLPLGFTSTVESARALLSPIAGATIAFAGLVTGTRGSLTTHHQRSPRPRTLSAWTPRRPPP